MKKIIISFLLLASMSIQPMSLRPLIKKSARMPQKLATVGSKRSMYECAIASAVITGTFAAAANFKLAIAINKVKSKVTNNINEDAQAKNIEMLELASKADSKLVYSNVSTFSVLIISSFGYPHIAWAGVSTFLALDALININQGFKLSQLADKKIDFLILENKESK